MKSILIKQFPISINQSIYWSDYCRFLDIFSNLLPRFSNLELYDHFFLSCRKTAASTYTVHIHNTHSHTTIARLARANIYWMAILL